ncbi:hypothetical protein EAF00_000811 [Botryotinia globosa]|nr:hypothetical protein EAF00_000811 [Botryotinia globosa]
METEKTEISTALERARNGRLLDWVIGYRSVRWTFHFRNLFYFLVEVQDASYKAHSAQNMLNGANDTSKERITEQTGPLGQMCEMEYMDALSRIQIDD